MCILDEHMLKVGSRPILPPPPALFSAMATATSQGMNGLQHYRKSEELTFLGLLNPEELAKRRCLSVDTV
jgi:hypothetical protein